MDSIFLLEDGARATYLQQLMRSLRCTYICLWCFFPHTNCLISMGGFYDDENIELSGASTSSGVSLGRRFFDDYRNVLCSIENDHVPGLAFKNGIPFMELKEAELQRLVSQKAQMQFYQEAKIKNAVFMGCKAGEIELGFNSDHPQVNMETELKNWFPDDFLQRAPPLTLNQTRPTSSSSSLNSLSMDSSECSPFLFNMPNTPLVIGPTNYGTQIFEPTLRPTSTPPQNTLSPLHQAIMQPYRNTSPLIPATNEDENEAMAKAILAVLSASNSPPNSSSSSMPQNVGINYPLNQKDNDSAFKRYGLGFGSNLLLGAAGGISFRKQNMFKKSIGFFRSLHLTKRSNEKLQGSRPNTTQMHHMISERKRREKLNDSFETLRLLLPPGTKKDKATVLKSTTECLASLIAQVADLEEKNQKLAAKLSHERDSHDECIRIPSNERLHVHITNLPETTSQGRIVDLIVLVRGDINNLDLVIRVLEFMKQVENIEVMSMEADTKVDDSNSINRVVLRLKIEGFEWDESAFREAVKRMVADMTQ